MKDLTRYAIIADIHANNYALNSFLDYIENNFNVEKILNVGDSVHIGPQPKEVVQTILTDKRFVNVLGNNELVLLGKADFEMHEDLKKHTSWTANEIGEELIEKMKNIPEYSNFESNNRKFLMLHSHFYTIPNRTIQDNILLYQGKSLDKFIDDYPKDNDIIILGHTHEQMYIEKDNKIILNPGSLSITKQPKISFCLIEFNSTEFNVIFKNISYDVLLSKLSII